MAPWKPINEKIVQGRKFVRKIEAYMYWGPETRANWGEIGHDCKLKNLCLRDEVNGGDELQ